MPKKEKSDSLRAKIQVKKIYKKPEALNCPECGSNNTVVHRTAMKGAIKIQYRVCRNLVCLNSYKVTM